jgi:hypothetical protein
VLRKNRFDLSNHYSQVRQGRPVIDRLRPGKGYKHYLTISDVRRFIGILPDWNELSIGLDAIVLAQRKDCLGWHRYGVVAVCAWERQYEIEWATTFVNEVSAILDCLGVRREPNENNPDATWCYFDDASIKGFQLMDVLLHELGHHHDRMTTRSRRQCARGEPYAEAYAVKYADRLWDAYFREFNW